MMNCKKREGGYRRRGEKDVLVTHYSFLLMNLAAAVITIVDNRHLYIYSIRLYLLNRQHMIIISNGAMALGVIR